MKYLIICFCIALTGCFLIPDEEELTSFELPEPPAVTGAITYPVERDDIFEAFEGSVRVAPVREVALYFEVGGRVRTVEAAPNQTVREGEVLAQLEIEDLEHNLALSRIDYLIAEKSLKKLEIEGTASIDLDIQLLRLEKQKLAVEYLERRVEAATISAPFSGVIKRVQISVSDLAREYEPAIVLSDPTQLEMQMAVNQDVFLAIDNSVTAEIQVRSDTWIPADIVQATHLDPRLDASISRDEYIVHLAFPDDGPELRISDRMPGRIVLQRHEQTLIIPSAALREFSGRTYVRVLTDGVRREVDVRVGIHTGTKVEIVEGLEEGELVIGK